MSTQGQPLAVEDLPLALADLHRDLPVGATATLAVDGLGVVGPAKGDVRISDLIVGAGFTIREATGATTSDTAVKIERQFTLADTVGPNMSLLICGLNPSLYSAEVGVGFGRPGNRFWPAAIGAGLVTEASDPRKALVEHGVGMTDLVKRPTRTAAELSASEYDEGLSRVERLVGWLQPAMVCFVGLAGWRAVIDRKATAGLQPVELGGVAVYLMPSTSGLNAHSRIEDLTEHLRQAKAFSTR